jgi:hypothetical protein
METLTLASPHIESLPALPKSAGPEFVAEKWLVEAPL